MTLQLLRNRNFALLWLAQILATLGEVLYTIGVMVVIFERTGSALQTTGVMIASTLPLFLFGPLAGVAVDRYPRKGMMLAMNLLRAGLVGLLLLFVHDEAIHLWGIYSVIAGLTIAATFYNPARLAAIPSLVAEADLVRANSLIMTTNQAAFALGYALGGMLILELGFQALVILNLASFALAALAVLLIAMPKRTPADHLLTPTIPLGRAIFDGLAYLRQHALARPLIIMEVLEHIPHAIWTAALMLVFTQEALGGNAEDWGYQNSLFYGGQLVGAAIATWVAGPLAQRPGWVIIWNALLSSLLTLGYALSPTLSLAIILCFLFGPTSAMRDIAQDSLLQASISAKVMGRIYASRAMLVNLSFTLASAGFAWLADQMPIRWIYLLGGLLYLGTGLYALSKPAIRRSRLEQAVMTSAKF